MEYANFDELETPNLKDKQVFTYMGSNDPQLKDKFDASLKFFNRGNANVTSQYIHDFSHVLPSNLPEDKVYHPYMSCYIDPANQPADLTGFNNCGYNMAYYMLQAWNPTQPLVERALNHTALGSFHAFNQSAFVEGLPNAKLSKVGYIYIPDACKAGNYCQSIMFLHGCYQSGEFFKETMARRTGLLEYAATNNFVVIFPQNDDAVVMNQEGVDQWTFKWCWSSSDTNDKFNDQIQALMNMLYSMFLGSENDQLASMVQSEISSTATAQKAANLELMDIDNTLDLVNQVLLI